MINRYIVFHLGEIIARIKHDPTWSRVAWPLMHACGPYFGPCPGRKPGTRSAPGYPSKTYRRIESGGAAGGRENPRHGAQLRGPCCTGRAWWPVDLGTWAAPAWPVAVVIGAQLFAPRYVHTFAVIRSQVSTCVRSYSRTWWPGPWWLGR